MTVRDAKVAEIKLFADSTIALQPEMLIFQHYEILNSKYEK